MKRAPCMRCKQSNRSPSGNCRFCARQRAAERRKARKRGPPTEHGRPCHNCSGRLRNSEGQCVVCRRTRHKRWVQAQRAADLDAWRAKQRAAQTRYKEKNPEKARMNRSAATMRWRETHAEAWKTYARDWWRRNPEKRRQYQKNAKAAIKAVDHRRRAAKRKAAGTTSGGALLGRAAVFDNRCWVCGGVANAIDHVIALCNGGTNWPANLRPICTPCNGAKGGWEWSAKPSVVEIYAWATRQRTRLQREAR